MTLNKYGEEYEKDRMRERVRERERGKREGRENLVLYGLTPFSGLLK